MSCARLVVVKIRLPSAGVWVDAADRAIDVSGPGRGIRDPVVTTSKMTLDGAGLLAATMRV
jgi:hypothetical protein